MTSILQTWVTDLPLREQGALVVGLRGCDLTPKNPLDSTERQLVGYLRHCVLVPADPREVGVVGGFFQPEPPIGWKQSELGHYPMHYVSHLMHAYEVVAYRHPDPTVKLNGMDIYYKLVRGLHLNPESRHAMIERLSEDRIENGTVVS